MRTPSEFLALIAGIALTSICLPRAEPCQCLELDRNGETIVLEPYAPNTAIVEIAGHSRPPRDERKMAPEPRSQPPAAKPIPAFMQFPRPRW